MRRMKAEKIALFIFVVLVSGSGHGLFAQQPSATTGGRLEVELRMPEIWKSLIIGPSQTIAYPKIPDSFSMFMTGELTGALKPYLVIEDSAGIEHSILLAMTTGQFVGGKVLSLTLRNAHETSHNTPGVFPLSKVKPPVKLKGILLTCRKPLQDTILFFDNIRFDNVMVEDFEGDRGWRVIKKEGGESRCSLKISYGPIPGRAMDGLAIKEPFPEREGCLTNNSSFEKDDDGNIMPDGWEASNKKTFIPRDSYGRPMLNPKSYKGDYTWENMGAGSQRSISISVKEPNSCAAVAAKLKKVKPNTDYTVSLWYRQPKAGDTVLMVFGTRVRMNRQFGMNSEHWCRYSGIFSSGSFCGDCVLAVGVVNPTEPTKIYV